MNTKFSNKQKALGIALGTALSLAVIGYFGVKSVSAGDSSTLPPLLQAMAERFNLDESKVKDFVDEYRAEHPSAGRRFRQGRRAFRHKGEMLDKLVEEGKITEEEKNNIIKERDAFRKEIDKIREDDSLSFEKKREKILELREARRQKVIDFMKSKGVEFPVRQNLKPGQGRGYRM